MDAGALQQQLGGLVDAAVARVLQQYGELQPSGAAAAAAPPLQSELQAARREVSELKATLAEIIQIDNAEFKRLWATIGAQCPAGRLCVRGCRAAC